MKLMYPEYNLSLEMYENRINVLVIENPAVMTEIVGELYRQCNGVEGKFVLSESNKILQFSKTVNLMMDIFSLNCNDKKIVSKLYQEIEEIAIENLIQESMEINAAIMGYLEKMCERVPYHIEYQSQILPTAIMKMVDLRFADESVTLLENIIQHLGIVNKIFKYGINIFVNLKSFLTEEQLEKLYEYTFYNKIPLLLIERTVREKHMSEDVLLIDIDKCTIKI